MAAPVSVDVLVIEVGLRLAAAVSAHRAVPASLSPPRARCSPATRRRRRADPGASATTTRPSSTPRRLEELARDRDRRLVEVLTGEAPGAIHWLEELGVQFTRENGGYRLAKCGGASRKRLLQVGDRTGHAITAALRMRSRLRR